VAVLLTAHRWYTTDYEGVNANRGKLVKQPLVYNTKLKTVRL